MACEKITLETSEPVHTLWPKAVSSFITVNPDAPDPMIAIFFLGTGALFKQSAQLQGIAIAKEEWFLRRLVLEFGFVSGWFGCGCGCGCGARLWMDVSCGPGGPGVITLSLFLHWSPVIGE